MSYPKEPSQSKHLAGDRPRGPVLVAPPEALGLVNPEQEAEDEHSALVAAIENLGSEQRITLWFLAEHPAVLDLVDQILNVVPQEIEK